MVPRCAAGGWWFVYVDDVENSIINGDRDTFVCKGSVAIEQVIGGKGSEGYVVMD